MFEHYCQLTIHVAYSGISIRFWWYDFEDGLDANLCILAWKHLPNFILVEYDTLAESIQWTGRTRGDFNKYIHSTIVIFRLSSFQLTVKLLAWSRRDWLGHGRTLTDWQSHHCHALAVLVTFSTPTSMMRPLVKVLTFFTVSCIGSYLSRFIILLWKVALKVAMDSNPGFQRTPEHSSCLRDRRAAYSEEPRPPCHHFIYTRKMSLKWIQENLRDSRQGITDLGIQY